MVVGLDYRDVELSVHDLLQELKTHPRMRAILDGGERVEWGAKTIPEGGFVALPRRFHAPGLLLCGRRRRARQRAGAEGHPLRDRVGPARGGGGVGAARRSAAAALAAYDDALRTSFVWSDLGGCGTCGSRSGGSGSAARWRARRRRRGPFPPGDRATERDDEHELFRPAAPRYPAPDGKLTFDKLSSVFLSGNRTRDDQPSHIRMQTRVPRELAELWAHMCPAQVYEVGEAGRGQRRGEVAPSNCVQCGAITAKGGRLTPPEGGAGPEYTLT